MTSKVKNILIISITGVIIIGLFLFYFLTNRVTLNDDYISGNTAGNLNNGGFFCESDGRVYFANAYDSNTLYSMNSDGTDIRKLNNSPVSSINAAGKYLYYSMTSGSKTSGGDGLGYMMQTSGIYRSNLKGKSVVNLDRCHTVSMQLCGSYLYYEKYDNKAGTSLDKIRIDKKDKQTVANEIINPNCYVNGKIYYPGTSKDHYLHALDIATDTDTVIWKNNIWNPIVQDGYVYYMDIAENYRLCRYSMSEDVVEVLTNDRIDMFNVYRDYIYYQVSSQTAPALKRMMIDGSSQEIVQEGVFQNINITSAYVYFNGFDAPVPVYRTNTYGPVNVTTFDAAKQAAAENIKK